VHLSLKRLILDILTSAAIWFITIIAIVYLGNGYLYSVEIPRLVLLFSILFYIPLGIILRFILSRVVRFAM
jgi:hypothetical protein